MAGIEQILSQPWSQRLGWSLVHFLWQGLVVAALLSVAMTALRRRSANLRYAATHATATVPQLWAPAFAPAASLPDRPTLSARRPLPRDPFKGPLELAKEFFEFALTVSRIRMHGILKRTKQYLAAT